MEFMELTIKQQEQQKQIILLKSEIKARQKETTKIINKVFKNETLTETETEFIKINHNLNNKLNKLYKEVTA